MSELAEDFRIMKEISKVKRAENLQNSLKILDQYNVKYKKLSDTHVRVGEYDYWLSTGLFMHFKTKKRGRGVFVLMRKLGIDIKLVKREDTDV